MSELDAFSTIAEVAIAFLGFTGVVGIFGGRAHPPAVSLRLWVMVEFGLALLLLALLPGVLHHLGWSGETLWVACGIAILLFLIGHLVVIAPRVARLRRAGAWRTDSVLLDVSFPLLCGACFATQVLNVIGVGLARSPGGFLLGLFFLVAASGLNFSSLLAALRSAPVESKS